jgi:multiple sugar transport system substrate-binding protein
MGCTLAAVGALTLAGCSSGDSGDGASGSDDRGPITLAMHKDTSGNVQHQLDVWNKAHPKEKATIAELPVAADAQLQQMAQNAQVKSDTYSVLALDVTWTGEFAANRWIDPVPDSLKKAIDPPGVVPGSLDSGTYRGTLYAVPWQGNGSLLFYRTDLLKAAGIKAPPTTWEEMLDDCTKVRKLPQGKDKHCYTGQFDKYEGLVVNFSEAVQSAGGRVFDAKGQPTVDTPQAKAALTWLADNFEKDVIPKASLTYQEENARKAFQDGSFVFERQWPYMWDLANKTDGSSKVAGKFNVAPIPGQHGPGSSTLGGFNLAVSSFAQHKATARDFIAYMTSEKAQRANMLATSEAPTRSALYDDAALLKKYPYIEALKMSMQRAVPRPLAVRYGDVSAAIQEAVYPVISGEGDVAGALHALQAKLTKITAKP